MDKAADILHRLRLAIAAANPTAPVAALPTPRGLTNQALIERFAKCVADRDGTVERVADEARIPHAVADHLARLGLMAKARVAADPWLRALPWDRRRSLSVTFGRAQTGDQVGVARALAGVAETGTLVIPSGSEQATSLLFLPTVQIVILSLHHIVGTFDDAWHGLAIRQEARGLGLPASISMITGALDGGRLHVILAGEPDATLP